MRIPEHLQPVFARANQMYLRGDFEGAIAGFNEIICAKPNVADPFILCSEIYLESMNPPQKGKALVLLMTAAFIRRSDADLWRRCGQLSLEENKHMQAVD